MAKRWQYMLIFVLLLALACCLLSSTFLGRLFYPLHYKEHILASAEKYDVDPLLIAAVIRTESSFRETVVSSKGARGLMQLMPETAEWAAGQAGLTGYHHDQLFDPAVNIGLGTWYLSNLLESFDNNRAIALAAYNSGCGQVTLWLQKGIWDGREESLDQVPFSETRIFVSKVLQAYSRYRQLYAFGQSSQGGEKECTT